MSLPTRLTVIVLVLLLTACGFQLRGQVEVPEELKNIRITGLSEDSELFGLLEDYLGTGGVRVNSKAAETARLSLRQYNQQKDILVVGTDGRVREYRLISSINMSLTDPSGKILIDDRQLSVYRDFLYNPDDVLGKGEEEQLLRREMTQDLAQQIIARLTAIVSQ